MGTRLLGVVGVASFLALTGVPAASAGPDPVNQARKALAGGPDGQARSSAAPRARLPLPRSGEVPAGEARTSSLPAGTDTLLVGAATHADVPSLEDTVRSLGGRVESIDPIGVLVVRSGEARLLAATLRGDPRVSYVEAPKRRALLQEPFDQVDPRVGIPFTWGFSRVRAAEGLAAVGGTARLRVVAVIDSGLDVGHSDIGPVTSPQNAITGSTDVTDTLGHGTFVTGLINAPANGVGMRGVGGGALPVQPLLVTDAEGGISTQALVNALVTAIESRARIVNLSLGGGTLDPTEARALDFAFYADVLPVAAAGNEAEDGNPVNFPAALVGGFRGAPDIGLSVGATRPDDKIGSFSTHNDFVSVSAPGAGLDACHGVLSTIPRNPNLLWDGDPENCAPVFSGAGGRWAYSEGTSFATPIVSGVAALTWEAAPRLQSEQVADVLMRSAENPRSGPQGGRFRSRWDRFFGRGIVDAAAATALARRYDTTEPRLSIRYRRRGARVRVTATARDRTASGRELARGESILLGAGRNRDQALDRLRRVGSRKARRNVRLRRGRNVIVVGACDRNGNCRVRTKTYRRR